MSHATTSRETDSIQQNRVAIRVALLCGFVLLLDGYDIGSMSFTIPSLSQAWHLRPAAFTGALTAGNLGLFIGSIFCGWMGDRVGRKPMLIACVTAFGAMSLLTTTVHGPLWLAFTRLGTGIGLGGGLPLTTALLSDFSPPKKQGALVIAMSCGVALGNIVGGFVAARLLAPYGWQSVFFVGGLAPLIYVPFLLFLLPESLEFLAVRRTRSVAIASPNPSGVLTVRPGQINALLSPGLRSITIFLWMVTFLSLLTLYFINSWLPAMLHSLGLVTELAIITTTMYHFGGIAGGIVSGPIVNRFGVEKVFAIMLIVAAACILVIGLTNLSILLIGACIFGAGFGVVGAQLGINSLPGAIYPPAIRSTGTGWAVAAGRLGNIAGPLLGGILLSLGWSPKHMFLAFSIPIMLLAGLLLAFIRIRAPLSGTPAPQGSSEVLGSMATN